MDTGSAVQMLQRLQDLKTAVVERLDRALLEMQNAVVLREGAQERGGMAQLELD